MKQHFLSRRGQAAVTDLFISISVFIILITIITLTWNLYNIRLQNRFDYDDMMIKAFQVTDSLVKGRGVPTDWETQNPVTNVQVLGLSENERFLSEQKVKIFAKDPKIYSAALLSDAVLKSTLKINLYNYYFVLRHLNGTVTGCPSACNNRGTFPSGNYVVNLARLVMYQNQPVYLEFAVWK
ncbi:MAG: hypothetical protein AABW64_00245 [Nanoarchaeota archaeon]